MSQKAAIRKLLDEIRPDTRRMTDKIAYGHYLAALDAAFQKDGLRGVMQISSLSVHNFEEATKAAEQAGSAEELSRAAAATWMSNDLFPKMMDAIAKMDDEVEAGD
ncbi:hypothetical protein SAMN05446935_0367 [Burkholderia sp. YR290]|nr:hypothetical protein SAMN05446935_0367 [Burkholderia sp. YR290]